MLKVNIGKLIKDVKRFKSSICTENCGKLRHSLQRHPTKKPGKVATLVTLGVVKASLGVSDDLQVQIGSKS